MSTFDQVVFHRAIALQKRFTFLEHQMAELANLRNRLARAELRRSRLRGSRSAFEKVARRRTCS